MIREFRLKDLGRWRSGGTPPKNREDIWTGEVPWLSAKDINRDRLREPKAFITEEGAQAHSRVVAAGSILAIVRGMALVHGIPFVMTDHRVAFNQDLRALEVARDLEPRFVYYALRGHRHKLDAHIDRAAHGTARVADSVYGERLPVLAQTEQVAVADFLDRECDRIDALRGEAEAPPELVNELLRSRLAESASGCPKRHLKSISTRITSGPRGWGNFTSPDGRVLFVGISALQKESLSLLESGLRRVNPPPLGGDEARASTENGDVLLSITAELGTVGLVPPRFAGAVVSQHVALVRPDPALVDCRWLALVLKGPQLGAETRALGYGGTKQGLGLTEVGRLEVPLPQLRDQRAMLDELVPLQRATTAMLTASTALRASLSEYRDALITEAVTGKLDIACLSDQQLNESALAAMEGEQPAILST